MAGMFKSLSATLQNSELSKRCEEQEETIHAYEKKLKEVIRAYKSLNKEKKALQASLEAMAGTGDAASEASEGPSGAKSEQPGESESEAESTREDERLNVLQRALATVSKEKSRLETAYQADKRGLLKEREEAEEEWERGRIEWQRKETLLSQQVAEARAALRQATVEREGADADHGAVLAELHQSLSAQRMANDHLAAERDALKAQADRPDPSADLVASLRSELKHLRDAAAKREAELASLRVLEDEVAQLRLKESQTAEALSNRRVAEAEAKGRWEGRMKELEASLAELSALVGQKEREKAVAEDALPKMRARLQQLESDLAEARQTAATAVDDSWPGIQARLSSVGAAMRAKADVPPPSLDIYSILGLDSPSAPASHVRCQAELDSLRDEFDKYKLRAQTVLKSRSSAGHGGEERPSAVEVEREAHLRSVIASLQQKLSAADAAAHAQEAAHAHELDTLRRELRAADASRAKVEGERKKAETARVSELESELGKVRERTRAAIAEKEEELKTARTIIASLRHVAPGAQAEAAQPPPLDPAAGPSAKAHSPGAKSASSVDEELETRGAEKPGTLGALPEGTGEGGSVYFAGELAKREREVGEVRRALRAAESALRDLQHSTVTKELRHLETLEAVKEELRRAEGAARLRTDGANLEYLRNVLLQYCLCDSAHGKAHMLKALGQLLQLSPNQIDQVKKHNERWYWWHSTTNPKPQ